MLGDALEVAGEPVGVAGVAEHPRLLQPVRGEQPPLVEQVQVGRALGVRRRRGAHQPGQQRTRDLGVGVDLGDRRLEVGPVAVQPQREGLPPVGAQPARADESVQAERALELPGRRGVDLARCAHPSHPRIAGRLRSSACACPSAYLLVAGVVTAVVVGGGVVALGRARRRADAGEGVVQRRRRCRTFDTTGWSVAPRAVLRRDRRPPGRGGARRRCRGRTESWENGDTDRPRHTACRTSSTSSAAATPPRTARSPRRGSSRRRSTPARAQRLVKAAPARRPGCEVGSRAAVRRPRRSRSPAPRTARLRASYRGLFGDAWLVCEVARRRTASHVGLDVVDRGRAAGASACSLAASSEPVAES